MVSVRQESWARHGKSEKEKANANRRSATHASVPHAGSEEMVASLVTSITNQNIIYDAEKENEPARTTTVQRVNADRRGYSDGPNTKRILKLKK